MPLDTPPRQPQFQSPFQSPNAIPPRTSSHGIVNGVKHRSSVLRPLSEVEWMSKKSKREHRPDTMEPTAATKETDKGDGREGFGDELVHGHDARWTAEKERMYVERPDRMG